MILRLISNLPSLAKVTRLHIFLLSIFLLVIAYKTPFVQKKIQSHAITRTEHMFGGQRLPEVHELKIRQLAAKLGVTQLIHIRRMNPTALQLLGYHNAFAYHPHLGNILPIGNDAFVYISEGFFEDLSPEEQEFLIGHELVHIKHEHVKYVNLIYLVLFALSVIGVWYLRRTYTFGKFAAIGLAMLLLFSLRLGYYYYLRQIERDADLHSLQQLGTHAGMLQIIDRWVREYKMPVYQDYSGLFADHPCVSERRAYCLESQQNYKGS